MEQNENPEIYPDTYSQLIFDKVGKNIKWEKDSLYRKWCWENGTAACKSVKLEHTLTPCTNINSKWLKALNVRQDTLKLLEENIGKTFFDINCTNVFLGQSPTTMEIKTKINQWDLIKLRNFCTAKETVKQTNKQTKKQPTEWEKRVSKDATEEDLISKIYKQLTQLNSKKTNNSIEKWAKDPNRYFSREDL